MHRGKFAILAMVAIAMLLSGYAWWHWYQQGRRCLALWGAENSLLIRKSPRVELLSLDPGKTPADDAETLDVAGRKVAIVKHEDISRAGGVEHARYVFIEDSSFDWQRSNDGCSGQWSHALRFSDGKQSVHVVLDLECGRATLVEAQADVRLMEHAQKSLAKYLRERSKADEASSASQ